MQQKQEILTVSQLSHAIKQQLEARFPTVTVQGEVSNFKEQSSGHFYYQANGNGESQLNTLLCVLKVLTEEGKSLSELAKEVQRSHESGEFNFRVTNAPEILESLKERYKDGELVTIDGISVNYPNWRFNVRTSNTEPLLRLNVESFDEKEMEEKRDELMTHIKNIAKIDTTGGH